METAPVIRSGPPLSVRVRAAEPKPLEPAGSSRVTLTEVTGVFRVAGATAAIESMDSGATTWVVAWAEVGVAWILPTLSVATL